nr:hypothetical protein [Tanacetum cinerariifolium]
MPTQQDIDAVGSKTHPPMLNKENYVPWSSRLLCYAKSRPNEKLIYNSIINGPYVRRMIPEPCDQNREEIWLRVQQMMKGYDIGIQEKKAKIFNECERFTSTDEESIESYYHHFLKLMNDFKRNKHFPKKIASNIKFLNNLQPEWSRHITIVHQTKDSHITDYTQLYDFLKYNQNEVDDLRAERLAKTHDPLALMENSNNPFNYPVFHPDQPSLSTYMKKTQPNNSYNPQPSLNQNYMQQPMPNPEYFTDPTTAINMALVLMDKAFKLNYSTPTNNNQRISSNPCNRNHNGYNEVQNVGNQVVQKAFQNPGAQNELHSQTKERRCWLSSNSVADCSKGGSTNPTPSCILMANLQQASTSGLPKIDESHALSKPVTSNLVPTPRESIVMNNERVIAPGIFRINSFKASRIDNFVPNKYVKASAKTKPITVSQPHVITKKDINYNTNGFSPKDVESTTRTRRPHLRNNLKNDEVPFKSKSSCLLNNLDKIEENHRNLHSFTNQKHTSSA